LKDRGFRPFFDLQLSVFNSPVGVSHGGNQRNHHAAVHRVQAAELLVDEEPEEDDRQDREEEVLPVRSEAHGSSRGEIAAVLECSIARMPDLEQAFEVSSRAWREPIEQSSIRAIEHWFS
jgi:hypothetical protein